MVGREKQEHKWTRLPMIGETVCEHCGEVRAGWNENTRCIPPFPRPDIEAMKSIGRNNHGY